MAIVQPYWESTPNLPAFSAVPQPRAPPWASISRGCNEQFLYCLCLVFVVTVSSIYCLSPWIYQANYKYYVVTVNIISHPSSWSSLHLGCWLWACKTFKATFLLLQRHFFKQRKSSFQIECSRSSATNCHKIPRFYPLLHTAEFVKCCSAFNYMLPFQLYYRLKKHNFNPYEI
jgi:hypothetical protein